MTEKALGFYYADLGSNGVEQLDAGHKFDGMTHGHFIDMWGMEINISKRDLESYVSNTKEVIKASTTESGEIVGLPIDCVAHERGNAAGWIVDVELAGDVVKFTPTWTELGRELISKKLQRLFSPTLDIRNKCVLGGSLTNWPATRDKKGRVLIKPIELSESLENDDPDSLRSLTYQVVIDPDDPGDGQGDNNPLVKGTEQMTPEEIQELVNGKVKEIIGDLSLSKDQIADLVGSIRQQITAEMEAESKKIMHETSMANLAAQLVKGTADVKVGLPVDEADLAAHLKLLPTEEAEYWTKTLSAIQKDGLVDFSESGNSSQKSQGHHELPEDIIRNLESGTLKVSDLNDPILALGDLSEYDLSRWTQKP